jgi:hypothetical protein
MGLFSGIRLWLGRLKRAQFIHTLSKQTPEQLSEYNNAIRGIFDAIEGNNVALLHYATGRAITTWALMEERLVMVASLLLKTTPQKTGLIFYSIINFQVWITIITELFELDQEFAPFQRRWNKLFERLRAEKDNRDRLAHHYVMSSAVSDNPLGVPIKKASRIDMRIKSQKAAPMTVEQVRAFQTRIEAITDDLLTFWKDMAAELGFSLPSQETPSAQPPDQAT